MEREQLHGLVVLVQDDDPVLDVGDEDVVPLLREDRHDLLAQGLSAVVPPLVLGDVVQVESVLRPGDGTDRGSLLPGQRVDSGVEFELESFELHCCVPSIDLS